MRKLVWSATFVRAFKRMRRRRPNLRATIESALDQLCEDPFHARLRTHKLHGEMEGIWACTVEYDFRILFDFVKNPESGEDDILLLTMGSHEEVY